MKKTTSRPLCNVFASSAGIQRLWQFEINSGEAVLTGQRERPETEPVPAGVGAKDWRCLWQRKLNLAWLPSDQVFLRVIHLPAGNPGELPAMVELQLEKLSPLPVNQIVWSLEVAPAHQPATALSPPSEAKGETAPVAPLWTVIVLITARNLVEEFLGRLEGLGYLADRLELPILHQLLATRAVGDGAWVYPPPEPGMSSGLIAWWSGGILQNLGLLLVPGEKDWAAAVKGQLTEMTWAGEMDGWLNTPPHWYLVADAATAAHWQPLLEQHSGERVTVVPALSAPELAAFNVRRVAGGEAQANLLPPEYAVRYRQRFVDRLWMRGLGSVVVMYLAVVLVYFGWLQVISFQKGRVDSELSRSNAEYQKARQLKERIQVMQEQVSLKFAALDCWKITAELLPQGLTLFQMSFQKGRKLSYIGDAPPDEVAKIADFNEALSRAPFTGGTNGMRMFSKVDPPTLNANRWSFNCELNFPEVE